MHITKTAGTMIENIAYKKKVKWGRYFEKSYEGEWHEIFSKK